MVDHGARDHAKWSASATARNWACAGALALSGQAPPDRENPAAAWGTACHQVSEKCLRQNKDAAEFIDTVEKTKSHEIEVDDELAETAQVYIDYTRAGIKQALAEGGFWRIEQHFALYALNPPIESGGTADMVLYYPKQKLLEVVDLKGGRGIRVEVNENKQARTYALGALLALPGLDVERVRSTIVQPRMQHKDGVIRSETYHVADLAEWTADLLAAMHRSSGAEKVFGDMPLAAWAKRFLVAGDHCKFCPAAGMCPALEQRAIDAAGVWFDDLDQPRFANTPDSLDPKKLSATLDLLDLIQEWMNSVRAFAHQQAEMGVEIPEYQLSDKIGNRKWAADDDKVRADLFLKADLKDEDVLQPRKLKSPAMIEKVLGKKRQHLIENMWRRDVTGTNLVRTTKTTRPAAPAAVNKHFAPIE